jgi:opacity protein-like surface antigen
MKVKAAVLGVALLVLGAGASNAGSNWIGVSGGAGVPTGDYGDAAATGWNLGVTGTHMVNDQWGFGGDLAYHAWGASDDLNAFAEASFGPGSEFSFSALQGCAHAVMAFPTQTNFKPYAKAGVGVYSVSTKLSSPAGDDSQSESKLGFNFGGGMSFPTSSNMKWGVNAAYHIVPQDTPASDVNFFSVGVNLLWGMSQK